MLYSTVDKNLKNIHHTDEELVSLYIRTGKNYYFGLLYMNCSKSVYRQCLHLVKDHSLAQDLTHDIFLKLLSVLPSFKGKTHFAIWLSRVTYNYCMDQFGIRRRRAEIPINERTEIPDDIDLINFLEDDSIALVYLTSALTNLPNKERQILQMRYTDNVSISEIAHTLKITVSAVKMRLLRSRKKLRDSCSAYYLAY